MRCRILILLTWLLHPCMFGIPDHHLFYMNHCMTRILLLHPYISCIPYHYSIRPDMLHIIYLIHSGRVMIMRTWLLLHCMSRIPFHLFHPFPYMSYIPPLHLCMRRTPSHYSVQPCMLCTIHYFYYRSLLVLT